MEQLKKIERLFYYYDMMLYVYFNEYEINKKKVNQQRFNKFYLEFCKLVNKNESFSDLDYETVIAESYKLLEDEIYSYGYSFQSIKIKTNRINEINYVKKQKKSIPDNYYFIFSEIIKSLNKLKSYFNILLLDGSYGSEDFKFGWSDIDIFCVLKKEIINDKNKLKYLRQIILDIVDKVYLFNIFQLHGIFITSSLCFEYHLERSLPIACLENGKNFTDTTSILLKHITTNKESNINYLELDIYKTFNKYFLKHDDIISKINILHSIYSFPFAFLQTVDKPYYKKESFKAINLYNKKVFINIDECYKYFNKLYHEWPKQIKLITLESRIRKLQQNVLNIQDINRLYMESEVYVKEYVNEFFDKNETRYYLEKLRSNIEKGLIYAKQC